MKGLTPHQSHAYSSIIYWIKHTAEDAPALALQKICNAPAFRKLLMKLVEFNLPVMEKHTAALQKEITKQRRMQKQLKSSKVVEAILRPVSSGISKKPRVDHAAKAAYLSEKLHLLPTMYAKFGGVDCRSDAEAEETIINVAKAQEVSGTEVVRYTGNGGVSGMATPKQKKVGAKGKKHREGASIDIDDENEVADKEINVARKDCVAYLTEQEIIRGTPEALLQMKLYCQAFQDRVQPLPAEKFKAEVEEVFFAGTKLSFDLIKDQILEFAERTSSLRTKVPATAWDLEDPIGIFNAIEHAAAQCDDAKIHRAFGQMQLFASVNMLVSRGRKSKQRYKRDAAAHELEQYHFLDGLADEKAGNAKAEKKKKMREKFRAEYIGGKNWVDMAETFGGTGVVFVFVMAEIGCSYVAHKYTIFQRQCFKYMAERLPSIRLLVGRMGHEALSYYCSKGYLSTDCITSIELATPLLGSAAVEEDEEVDEEEEEDEEEEDDEDEVMGD